MWYDCVILGPDGAWLQTTDRRGVARACWIGRVSEMGLRAFCAERGIRFVDARRLRRRNWESCSMAPGVR